MPPNEIATIDTEGTKELFAVAQNVLEREHLRRTSKEFIK
jgi:hypothetical protein